jgi:GH25 family lysozyme M1 (1,4-beta-N-acetylmuramidase)
MNGYLDAWSQSRSVGKLSLAQRLELALKPKAETLISGLDPTKLALMIDISHWQGDVDIARMVSEGSVTAGIVKASDGKQVQDGDPYNKLNYVDDWLYRNVQKCYDAKVPCIPYHYVQPLLEGYTAQGVADWNMETLHAALDPLVPKASYHAICLDVEEKKNTDTNGSDVVLKMMDAIEHDPKFSQVPLILYSSMSVLNYFTKLREQVSFQGANRNLWMAQWVWNTTTNCTWEYFWNTVVPKVSMKVLTPGWAGWWGIQWSASMILPGGTGRTDVSFASRTPEALRQWLGYTSPTPPGPGPDPDPGVYVTLDEFNRFKEGLRAAAQ